MLGRYLAVDRIGLIVGATLVAVAALLLARIAARSKGAD
jgi:hypothetical protein